MIICNSTYFFNSLPLLSYLCKNTFTKYTTITNLSIKKSLKAQQHKASITKQHYRTQMDNYSSNNSITSTMVSNSNNNNFWSTHPLNKY